MEHHARVPETQHWIQVPKYRTGALSPAEQFAGKPVHKVAAAVDLDADRLTEDYAKCLRTSTAGNTAYRGIAVQFRMVSSVFEIGEDLWAEIYDHGPSKTLTVWGPTRERCEELIRSWVEKYQPRKRRDDGHARFHLIESFNGELATRLVKGFKPFPRRASDKALHYGPDFLPWEKSLLAQLKREVTGLVILTGPPGVGKTTVLRSLMHRLARTHRFYFIPVHDYDLVSGPSMVRFWMNEQSVYPKMRLALVLEDAEALLSARGRDNASGVSTILNTADGLLGEFLRVQILATINCRAGELDPAVVRQGRLLAFREFRRLTRQEARELVAVKGLPPLRAQPDFSLAEIYARGREPVVVPSRRMGFEVPSASGGSADNGNGADHDA